MHRGEQQRRERRLEELAAMLGYPECRAEQCLRRCGTQQHDRDRLYQCDFHVEPGTASRDVVRSRFFVNTPLAARLPVEMFDYVGHVHVRPLDARSVERAIEHLAGGANEWPAAAVFLIAGL